MIISQATRLNQFHEYFLPPNQIIAETEKKLENCFNLGMIPDLPPKQEVIDTLKER